MHDVLYDDDKSGPLRAAALSAVMLVNTEGQERSGFELGALLREAGFVDIAVVPTFGGYGVVTGRRA